MCLDKSAHGLEPQHEIFRFPLQVDVTYDEVPMPPEYKDPSEKKLKVWHVQTASPAEETWNDLVAGTALVSPGSFVPATSALVAAAATAKVFRTTTLTGATLPSRRK